MLWAKDKSFDKAFSVSDNCLYASVVDTKSLKILLPDPKILDRMQKDSSYPITSLATRNSALSSLQRHRLS